MKTAKNSRIVLVTAPDLKTARALARAALEQHLAACANIVSRIESHYWWQGKLESSAEALILFKTTARNLKALEKTILSLHPYTTPEFITVAIADGSQAYLAWLAASATTPPRKK